MKPIKCNLPLGATQEAGNTKQPNLQRKLGTGELTMRKYKYSNLKATLDLYLKIIAEIRKER